MVTSWMQCGVNVMKYTDNSLPRNTNVESFDPTQFLQEEMFVEEERFVLRSTYKIKLKPFLNMNLYNLSCGTRF